MYRVLLPAPLDEAAQRRLEAGAEVVRPADIDEAALCRAIADCDALVARTDLRVTRALLTAGRRLRVVGVAGVGLDNVDVAAAQELGIALLSTPGAASDAVAEFAVGLILQLLRSAAQLAGRYRAGEFAAARRTPHGRELRELTVGIVGMGRIGSRVGRICAAGFGADVIYNDIVDVGPFAFPARAVEKPALWERADVVTLHVPLTDQTRKLIDAAVLNSLRPGALLVNTARGAIVDTAGLLAALESGRLGGAALDVTWPEPLPPDHPLLHHPRCIVTPHVAARTHGGLARMFAVVDDVLEFLGTRPD